MQVKQEQETDVEIIANNHHGCVTTCTLTFDLNHCELSVFRRLTRLNPPKLLTNSVQDLRRTSKHTRCCGADLDKILANRFPATRELVL